MFNKKLVRSKQNLQNENSKEHGPDDKDSILSSDSDTQTLTEYISKMIEFFEEEMLETSDEGNVDRS